MPAPPTPTGWLTSLLAATGSSSGRPGSWQCPSHLDSSPSLGVGTGRQGQALIHCQAGCEPSAVLDALGLSWADLRATRAETPEHHAAALAVTYPQVDLRRGPPAARGLHLEAVHDYDGWLLERWRDDAGRKEISWFTRSDDGTAIPGLLGTPLTDLPLYREREVRMAVAAGETVVVCESESSVDALNRAGIYATTWAGGAAAPNVDRLAGVLAGARVVVVPDHDTAGLAAGRSVWRALAPVADLGHVLPEPGQDARDLLATRGPAAFGREPPPAVAAWHDQAGHPDYELVTDHDEHHLAHDLDDAAVL